MAALVTGSTSNIGKAIAGRFAAEGAKVVVTGRDATRGGAVVETVRAVGGEATFVPHELDGSVDGSRELADLATGVYGSIDILVNNAGIYPPGGTLAIDGETFDRIMAVNVKAPFFLTAALVPAMAETGGGAVINLGSWGARLGIPAGTAYASSKGAMETLTRAWAAEFGPRGVRVNAISPGVTFDGADPVAEVAGPMMATTPLGRMVAPDAVARAAVFLASEDAADIHGTVLDVDGGRSSVLFAAR
jgi:NAD(P)-dependent dehydrogenase (short-subunit alcohol dehydrogenase family)